MNMESKSDQRTYPEFGDLTAGEIRIRLDAFDNLINSEMKAEYSRATAVEAEHKARALTASTDSDEAHMSAVEILAEINPDFKVIAHRGWSGSYPENTLIGMREAIKLGCHMIEFDVSLTADRKPIIIHDTTLSRTTNGCGLVSEHTFRELRGLDAGSWFHPKYAGAHLPSLDEVLLISRGSGIMVNIELKKEYWDKDQRDDSVELQVIRAIKKYRVEDRVIVSSFRWSFIERIREAAPEIKTALLHLKDVGKLNPAELKERYGIYCFNPHSIELTRKFVDRCHECDLKIYPFTINSYRDMETMLDMSVDGMFTNHPNRLFRFVEEHGRRIARLNSREAQEDVFDVDAAIKRMEGEEMDKARRRARWKAKRMLLESRRNGRAT